MYDLLVYIYVTDFCLSQAYLVDYGLAFRYVNEGKQKEYKEDPRRTHDGTIEFTSRDAHRGVCKCPSFWHRCHLKTLYN